MVSLDELRKLYGAEWTVREHPRPSATRRRQILEVIRENPELADLAMTIYADSLEELREQLRRQEELRLLFDMPTFDWGVEPAEGGEPADGGAADRTAPRPGQE
mgnify:CR=1 FL=1